MTGALTSPNMTVGDPLAGPDPAGSAAGPPRAARHSHHHPHPRRTPGDRYTRPGRAGQGAVTPLSRPQSAAATAAAAAAAAASTPGTRTVVPRPAARSAARVEVPVATNRGRHGVRGAQDRLKTGQMRACVRAVGAAAHLRSRREGARRHLLVGGGRRAPGRRRKDRSRPLQPPWSSREQRAATSASTSFQGSRRQVACMAAEAGAHLHCVFEGCSMVIFTCSDDAHSTH